MKSKNTQKPTFKFLSEYVDYLQSQGEYIFTQKIAKEKLGCSDSAIRIAANRLINKKRIIKLRYTFYLIIPLEYQTLGAPPPTWYIDALMLHHHQPYYVALLSAAALHGAAHQQPQVFQVITNKPLRPITIGRAKINFIVKKNLQKTPTTKIKTPTGHMNVSTPESTTFDLVHYIAQAGYLNNVATMLVELAEKIDPNKLLIAAKNETLTIVQRTGYLFTRYTAHANSNITQPLLQWLKKQKIHPAPLRNDKPINKNTSKNHEWQIYENETVEADL
jgi:predicted transcriptional regulator of viral defense system